MDKIRPILDRLLKVFDSFWRWFRTLNLNGQISFVFLAVAVVLYLLVRDRLEYLPGLAEPAHIALVTVGAIIFAISFRLRWSIAQVAVTGIVFFYLLFVVLMVSGLPPQSFYFYYPSYQLLSPALFALMLGPITMGILNIFSNANVPWISRIASLCVSFVILGFVLATIFVSFPAIWIISYLLYKHERQAAEQGNLSFRQIAPFFYLGRIISSQEFSITEAAKHSAESFECLKKTIADYTGTTFEEIDIADVAVTPNYEKHFLKIRYETLLQTKISAIFYVTTVGNALFLKWWFLLQGRIGKWDLVWYVLFAPITFPFWIIPWFRKEYSILDALAGNIDYTYDVFDIESYVTSFQNDFFNRYLDWLESVGVNVTAFRQHPPNFTQNIISGSGNIVGSGNTVGAQSFGSGTATGTVANRAS